MGIAFPTYTPADVDLWGKEFVTVAATRTIRQQGNGFETELEKIVADSESDAEKDEKLIDVFGRILDLRLKPKGQGRKLPSELLRAEWDADRVTIDQLFSFMEALGEADRPT